MKNAMSPTLIKHPGIRIALHVLFWIAYLLISVITVKRFYEDESLWELIFRYSVTLPVDIGATYFTVYWLFPKFLYYKKYLTFSILLLLSAVGFILLQRVLLWYVTYPLILNRAPASPFFLMNWFYSFTNIYWIVVTVAGIKLLQRNFEEEKHTQELNEKRIEAELKFLKAQVHPHFLFNTLNNLYALTLEQSPKAPEVVLKLSELLNYMLYECNEPTILISKEIKLIQNYLSLEQIRYENHLNIDFSVEGEIAGKKIAPMLLLPFVENAFKHGVSKLNRKARVKIDLLLENDSLIFSVTNSKPSDKQKDPGGYSEGIGLNNVKRRLDLMYPGNHRLDYHSDDSTFVIKLELKLL